MNNETRELLTALRHELVQITQLDAHAIEALAICTEALYRDGIMSLGDTGRRVWMFGVGMGVIVHENVKSEPTTYAIYDSSRHVIRYAVKWEEFRYAYQ